VRAIRFERDTPLGGAVRLRLEPLEDGRVRVLEWRSRIRGRERFRRDPREEGRIYRREDLGLEPKSGAKGEAMPRTKSDLRPQPKTKAKAQRSRPTKTAIQSARAARSAPPAPADAPRPLAEEGKRRRGIDASTPEAARGSLKRLREVERIADHPPLAIDCPTCGAKRGSWCKRPSGHRAMTVHAARRDEHARLEVVDSIAPERDEPETAGLEGHPDTVTVRILNRPADELLEGISTLDLERGDATTKVTLWGADAERLATAFEERLETATDLHGRDRTEYRKSYRRLVRALGREPKTIAARSA
jgi:hypothetical protein